MVKLFSKGSLHLLRKKKSNIVNMQHDNALKIIDDFCNDKFEVTEIVEKALIEYLPQETIIKKIILSNPDISLEDIIKQALKNL